MKNINTQLGMRSDLYSNASGSSIRDEYVAEIEKARQEISRLKSENDANQTRSNSNLTASNNWGKSAHEDWKDRNKQTVGVFIQNCVKTGGCLGQGQTGRGNRYNDRLKKAHSYYDTVKSISAKIATNNTKIVELENTLAQAKEALAKFDQSIADKVSQGHSPETATEMAQTELETAKAKLEKLTRGGLSMPVKIAIGVVGVGLLGYLVYKIAKR